MANEEIEHEEEEFRPKGAIAFFVLLISFFTIIWFILYYILMGRV